MTAPNPETTARVNWLRQARYFLLAAFLGTIAGFAGIYLTGGLPRNVGVVSDGSCVNASPTAKRLMPLAKGEVAAFAPNSSPRRATPLEFKDGTGRAVSLEDFKGRVVLINLWATWCVPCIAELPELDSFAGAAAGKGIKLIAVSQDQEGAKTVDPFLAKRKFANLKRYLDAESGLGFAYAANLPTTVLYDARGKEVARVIGAMEWNGPEAQALLKEIGG